MTREGRHPIWTWVIHTPWVLATIAILSIIGFFGSGAGNPLIQRYVVRRLQAATGARVDLGSISIRWLSLEATLKGIVLHGREPAGTEALLAADEIRADLRVDSFWGRQISLDELYVKHPLVHPFEPAAEDDNAILRSPVLDARLGQGPTPGAHIKKRAICEA